MEANNAVVAVADAAVRSIVVERRRRRSRRFNLGELGSQHPPIERLPLRLAVTVSPQMMSLSGSGNNEPPTRKQRRLS